MFSRSIDAVSLSTIFLLDFRNCSDSVVLYYFSFYCIVFYTPTKHRHSVYINLFITASTEFQFNDVNSIFIGFRFSPIKLV